MMNLQQPFLHMDCGEMREWLVQEAVECIQSGWKHSCWVHTFDRRVKILAARLQRMFSDVYAEVIADAHIDISQRA